ncbi:hypothetical protein BaRGS_00004177, partial [Batillaria attramentaria]
MSSKDRVKIIVKQGKWTPKAREGKLFHLLTARSVDCISPTVKIEVRSSKKSTSSLNDIDHQLQKVPEVSANPNDTSWLSAKPNPNNVPDSSVVADCWPLRASDTTTAPSHTPGFFEVPALEHACDPMMFSVLTEEETGVESDRGEDIIASTVASSRDRVSTSSSACSSGAGGDGGMDYDSFELPMGDLDLIENVLTPGCHNDAQDREEASSG